MTSRTFTARNRVSQRLKGARVSGRSNSICPNTSSAVPSKGMIITSNGTAASKPKPTRKATRRCFPFKIPLPKVGICGTDDRDLDQFRHPVGDPPHPGLLRLVQILLSLLVGFSSVMLASAHLHLSLYEEIYGYTYLRVFAHAFMVLLLLLTLVTLFGIWRRRFSLWLPYLGIALTLYLALNFANIDHWFADKNIQRWKKTGKIDPHYLGELSPDAVPLLLQLVENLDLEEADRNWLLTGLDQTRKGLNSKQELRWQAWNLSNQQTRKALQ